MNRDRLIKNALINGFIDAAAVTAFTILLLSAFFTTEAKADVTCRSATVKRHFDKQQGYPKGRKGYVVDHVCALEEGGLDDVINMQYQTIEEGKFKDRIERTDFGKAQFCTPENSTPTRQVFNCKKSVEK